MAEQDTTMLQRTSNTRTTIARNARSCRFYQPASQTRSVTMATGDIGKSSIGDSRDRHIDICRLFAMVVIASHGQTCLWGRRSRLSARYVLLVWNDEIILIFLKHVGSFLSISYSFLCQPTTEHNREAFACELTHSRLATIIVKYRKGVRDVWKSACRVNGVLASNQALPSHDTSHATCCCWRRPLGKALAFLKNNWPADWPTWLGSPIPGVSSWLAPLSWCTLYIVEV